MRKKIQCWVLILAPSKLTSNQHNTNGENLLSICVGCHVPETHRREAAEGEVQRRDVASLQNEKTIIMRSYD